MFERRRLRVYVAGPISSEPFEGIHRGFEAGRKLFLDGMAPYVPHFDAFWFLPEGNWNAYLEYDLEFVSVCDAVYRLAGESKGADLECKIAKELGIPVFYEQPFYATEGPKDVWKQRKYPDYSGLLRFAKRRGLNGVRKGGTQAASVYTEAASQAAQGA
jgi:hypothetical protein